MDLKNTTFLKSLGRKIVYKNGKKRVYVNCKCVCGNIVEIREDSYKSKKIKSCGCYKNKIKHMVKNQMMPVNIKNINNIIYYPIYNYNGYYISIDGSIYSELTDKTLKIRKSQRGYAVVSIIKDNEDKAKNTFVHRLIASVFLLNKFKKETINHKDFNTMNYKINNLEWMSATENQKHRFNSYYNNERKNKSAKLDIKEVEDIYQSSLSYKKLKEKYNVSFQTLYKIKNDKLWVEITKKLQKGNSNKNLLNRDTIEKIYTSKEKQKDIAKKYNVSRKTVNDIRNNHIHTDITQKYL